MMIKPVFAGMCRQVTVTFAPGERNGSRARHQLRFQKLYLVVFVVLSLYLTVLPNRSLCQA